MATICLSMTFLIQVIIYIEFLKKIIFKHIFIYYKNGSVKNFILKIFIIKNLFNIYKNKEIIEKNECKEEKEQRKY